MELNDSSGDLESGVEDGDESGETCVEGAGDVALAKRILTGISLACTGIRRLWETACRRERASQPAATTKPRSCGFGQIPRSASLGRIMFKNGFSRCKSSCHNSALCGVQIKAVLIFPLTWSVGAWSGSVDVDMDADKGMRSPPRPRLGAGTGSRDTRPPRKCGPSRSQRHTGA